ncbi:hypothetical protein SAMN05443574_1411 [Haloarcula vallismortis]|uniref:Uncharacterized protein n=2 Tax=Haloarcula vallismortis TaxID=28442 RepID=M0JI99_HALVA|nr:hypothetical protein C437_07577 [Haloarcula vallismortis ATCC 29715]SDX38504.1 hypothetical protein SAMN05443574_1411 [Haloarcula vallismortis]
MRYFWRRIFTTASGEELESNLVASFSKPSFKSHDIILFSSDEFTTNNRFTASGFSIECGIKLL